jgi:hypothetical protein
MAGWYLPLDLDLKRDEPALGCPRDGQEILFTVGRGASLAAARTGASSRLP